MPAVLPAAAFLNHSSASSSSRKSNKIRLLKNHTLVDPKHANTWLAQVEKSKKQKSVPWVDVGNEQEEEIRRKKLLARKKMLVKEATQSFSPHGNTSLKEATLTGSEGGQKADKSANYAPPAGANGLLTGSANHHDSSHQSFSGSPECHSERGHPESPPEDSGPAPGMFFDEPPEELFLNPNGSAQEKQVHIMRGEKKRQREEEEQEEKEVAAAIGMASPSPTPNKHKRKKRSHSMVNGVAHTGSTPDNDSGGSLGTTLTAPNLAPTAAPQGASEHPPLNDTSAASTLHHDTQKPRGDGTKSVKIKQEDNLANGHSRSPRKHGKKQGALNVKNEAGPSNLNGTAPNPTSKKSSEAVQEQRQQLPIAKGRDALIEEIRKNDVTVLLGETGSGKTTQIPQYILESGLASGGMIAVTQPRRVAATSLASRVALESGGRAVGSLVGYSVRFDEKSSAETKIKYMTDGMIVRELLSDSTLSAYSVVVVDEAHERTLRTDLLIANLKRIQRARNQGSNGGKGKGKETSKNSLKIVIMSATLDAEKFSKFFGGAKIIYVQGRQHPVKIYYSAQGQTDYVDSAMRTFFQIHLDSPPGDVLIFLPGQEDIEGLEKSIQLFSKQLPEDAKQVLVCPMYAAQAPGQNAKVFLSASPNTRKCILATNIAETSITIPGVKYVIDTGMCKEKRYLARDTGGGFDTLLTKAVTKSSATQRSGRAGREGPGMCFRLYTEESFKKMPVAPEPEIMRVSLTSSILQLKCLGQNLEELDLMDMPDVESVRSALKTLWLLDAIDTNRELTPLGRQMALFPLEPIYSRAILAAKDHGCTLEVIDIICVLSASSKIFIDISEQREAAVEARKMFRHTTGDHLTVLKAVRAYADITSGTSKGTRRDWCRKHFLNERALLEAFEIRNQLRQTCTRLKIDWDVSCGDRDEPVVRSLAFGLAQNSAFLQPDGSYKQTMGHSIVKIHPGSVLCEKKVPAIVYDELIFTNQIYARGVSSVPKAVFASIGALNRRSA